MANSVAQERWFVDMLMHEENSKEAGRIGSYWRPHKSPEGGLDTIGYGHKLVPSDKSITILDREFNLFTDKVPHKYIMALLKMDILRKEKLAAYQFSQHTPIKGKKWEDLDILQRAILTEINFNAGLVKDGKWGWPSLAKAMEANNITDTLKELDRFFTVDGEKRPLKSRVNRMRKVYKEQYKKTPTPTGVKGVADLIKSDFPHFKKLTDWQKQQVIKRYTEEDEAKAKQKAEDDKMFLEIEQQAELRDRREAQLMEEVEQEMTATEPATPRTVDEGVIMAEPLSDISYAMDDQGQVQQIRI